MLEKKKNAEYREAGCSEQHILGKRIMIVGCAGSGKTTMALKLSEITGLPVFHLDKYYWRYWQEAPDDQWRETVRELASGEAWIIDGNYRATAGIRLARADTVIFLDYSTMTCLSGVLKRAVKHRGTVRPDMGEGCKERIDWSFIKWVLTFRRKARKALVKEIEAYKDRVKVIVLTNRKHSENFLNDLIQAP